MKNYFIIGGSSGIGKALVALLKNQGHKVYTTYNQHHIEDNDQVVAKQLDVIKKLPAMDFLPETLDGFVFCPGSIQLKPFIRIKPESFIDDFTLQVGGAIKTLQLALPRLKAAHQASVVFFSTVAVQTGFNFHS